MSSRRIACLTARAYRDQIMAPGQLPPAEAQDFAILAPACQAFGLTLEPMFWDDAEGLATGGFDAALIRSAWDYHERPEAFMAALRALPFPVFNAAEIVAWNARKTYLQGLGDRGAPIIDTIWPQAITPEQVTRAFTELDAAEIVLKPQVGAGSRRTIRLARNSWGEGDLAAGPLGPAMIQPFLPAIQTEGEVSLFLFGAKASHAVRKVPARGSWFANVNDPVFSAMAPTSEMLEVAAQVAALAPANMLYARIDLVRGLDGRLKLIELEAIEPYLFFFTVPEGAPNLAAALVEALARA